MKEADRLILTIADGPWQVQAGDKNTFVFNTEAHPMRVVRS